MPQVFIVVRCFDCDTFQVQQSKKSPKWACKMCGQKQSLKKVYGKGSGADCRKLVQSLNLTAGEVMESRKTYSDLQPKEYESPHEEEKEEEVVVRDCSAAASRWSNFLEQSRETEYDDSNPDTEEPFNVVTERPQHLKRRYVTGFHKKQRFPKQNTNRPSNSYPKCLSENVDSEEHNQLEVSLSSYPNPSFVCANDFVEENDTLSSSGKNVSTPAETGEYHAPKVSFNSTNFKGGILREKIPQQTNVSIPKQCSPMKRKRKYLEERPKENSSKKTGTYSKWDMFVTTEEDNLEERDEQNVVQNCEEPEWIDEDLTARPQECIKPKIFHVGDVFEDDLTWDD